MIHIQSTHRTSPNFRKHVSLAVSFGSNGDTYTVSAQSEMCVYTYARNLHNIEKLVEQKKYKIETAVKCRVPRKSFHVPFSARVP